MDVKYQKTTETMSDEDINFSLAYYFVFIGLLSNFNDSLRICPSYHELSKTTHMVLPPEKDVCFLKYRNQLGQVF
jgi:hypothetical protein